VTCFLKTIERRWDGIVSRAEYDVSSGVIEGTNGFVKAARRASYGFNDFDYFGLLIWYQTHENPRKRNNYCSRKTTRSYKRTKAHNRRFYEHIMVN
ncbi:MAG: transposase, partial [Spirochaetaceae bacterium]|nr:transposase [Spirochaetaceae bacterium]